MIMPVGDCTIDRLLGYQSALAADMDDDDAGRLHIQSKSRNSLTIGHT